MKKLLFIHLGMSILVACLFSCSESKLSKVYSGMLKLQGVYDFKDSVSLKVNQSFLVQSVVNNNDTFLVTINGNYLSFTNLFNENRSFSINLKETFFGFSNYLYYKISDTFFYVLDAKFNLFKNQHVQQMLLTYKIDYNLKKLIISNISFLPMRLNFGIVSDSDRVIRSNLYSTIDIVKDKILLSYGIYNNKWHSFDNNSYMELNLKDTNAIEITLNLPVPEYYRKGKSYSSIIWLTRFDDSLLINGFGSLDSIYLFNLNSNTILKRIKFSASSDFDNFDNNKSMNLAYTRKFELTNEANVNFIVNKTSQRLLLIKRLKKQNINDTSVYEYYLFDKNLNTLAFNRFTQDVLPISCIPFRNGYLLLNRDRKKAYYYE